MIPLQGQVLMVLAGLTILVIVVFKSERVKTWIDKNGCRFGFHEWAEWRDYLCDWQRRYCKRCHKRQERYI